jgi:hypothetical protein
MNDICKQAIAHFGEKRQQLAAAEEYGELIVQLIKARNGRLKLENLRNELADAIIVTEQLLLMHPSIYEQGGWMKVQKSIFHGMTNYLINYMTVVINEILSTEITTKSHDAIVQISAILSRLTDYFGRAEIESIIAFKQRKLKSIIEHDSYSKEIGVW